MTPEGSPEPISSLVARVLARVDAAEARRRLVACWEPLGSNGEMAAVQACRAVRAWENCEFRADVGWCPLERRRTAAKRASSLLDRAGVEPRHRDLLVAAVRGASPLADTDARTAVRAVLAGSASRVTLANGNAKDVKGTETLLVLAGIPGAGKTLAACEPLAETEGMYLRASALSDRRFDLRDAEYARLLVLDDLGVEFLDDKGWALARLAEVIEVRHARKFRTIITTNLRRRKKEPSDPPQWAERYGARLDSRMDEGGLFVSVAGESLRGGT